MTSPRRLRLTLLVSLLALGATIGAGGAAPRPAAAEPVGGIEVDVSMFYDALSPHGDWIEVAPYGFVFAPDVADYGWRPYTVGHWVWVDAVGWTWISDEPWSWAVDHYGRWAYDAEWGWIWIPGVVWAPAWVVFRVGDGFIGWAPMPPPAGWRLDARLELAQIGVEVEIATYAWTFTTMKYFAEPSLASHLIYTSNNPVLVRATSNAGGLSATEGQVVQRGVDVSAVEKARGVPVPRLRLAEVAEKQKGGNAKIEGETVKLYRPRIAPRPPSRRPQARRAEGAASTPATVEAWLAARRAALDGHLDAQRKSVDQLAAAEAELGRRALSAEEAEKRRKATLEAIEEEKRRLEALFERQRRRREHAGPAGSPEPPPQPPAMGDSGMGDGGMADGGRGDGGRGDGGRGDGGMDDGGMNDGGMNDGGMGGGGMGMGGD